MRVTVLHAVMTAAHKLSNDSNQYNKIQMVLLEMRVHR
jgi:hypothetical protein